MVDKAKGQQMSQLVEHHKAEMLKLYQEKKASLLERRDELERRDSEWGNKVMRHLFLQSKILERSRF